MASESADIDLLRAFNAAIADASRSSATAQSNARDVIRLGQLILMHDASATNVAKACAPFVQILRDAGQSCKPLHPAIQAQIDGDDEDMSGDSGTESDQEESIVLKPPSTRSKK